MQQDIREKKVFREAGVCVLTADITLPLAQGEIGRFYERLKSAYISGIKARLAPEACREFLTSDDEKKRFTFRPFSFNVSYKYADFGDTVTVKRCEVLSRRGKAIWEREFEDYFSKRTGLFIRTKRKKSNKNKSGRS